MKHPRTVQFCPFSVCPFWFSCSHASAPFRLFSSNELRWMHCFSQFKLRWLGPLQIVLALKDHRGTEAKVWGYNRVLLASKVSSPTCLHFPLAHFRITTAVIDQQHVLNNNYLTVREEFGCSYNFTDLKYSREPWSSGSTSVYTSCSWKT